MTLHPFPTKHRLDGRSYSDRIGRPYYGGDLRRILLDESIVERNRGHEWRWVASVAIIAAIGIAALIVTL